MDLSVSNKLECWRQQFATLVSQVQLRLIAVQAMQRQLGELTPRILLDRAILAHNVTFDSQVVLEVFVDDARRDTTYDALQSDVRLQRWLKELDHARLTNFECTQIDDSEARVSG